MGSSSEEVWAVIQWYEVSNFYLISGEKPTPNDNEWVIGPYSDESTATDKTIEIIKEYS